jgi:ditrans,polycis-polyprenyl diphosphate synthase
VIFHQYISNPLRRLLIRSLGRHPRSPRHIAFIMDGNRRYARLQNRPISQGHQAGFGTLESVLESCLQLGVNTVSIYAFSIENFARPSDEVDDLMRLFKHKLQELVSHKYIISNNINILMC